MGLAKISITIYDPTKSDVDHVLALHRKVVNAPVMDDDIAIHTGELAEPDALDLSIVIKRYPF